MFTVKGIEYKFTPAPKFLARGFTLMEMLVVIIIVGILATLGIRQYYPLREKGIAKEAFVALRLIRAAEEVYFAENGAYYPASGSEASEATINTYLRLDIRGGPNISDGNWDYTVNSATATADRNSGPFDTCVYTITYSAPNSIAGTNCIQPTD